MFDLDPTQRFYVVKGKTDMRKGIDTLAAFLLTHFDQDPFDGAYLKLPGIQNVACLAHLRRKFYDALPKDGAPDSIASRMVGLCDRLFKLEAEWKDLSPGERLAKRQTDLAPLLHQLGRACRPRCG